MTRRDYNDTRNEWSANQARLFLHAVVPMTKEELDLHREVDNALGKLLFLLEQKVGVADE